jgi:hypothetical protein
VELTSQTSGNLSHMVGTPPQQNNTKNPITYNRLGPDERFHSSCHSKLMIRPRMLPGQIHALYSPHSQDFVSCTVSCISDFRFLHIQSLFCCEVQSFYSPLLKRKVCNFFKVPCTFACWPATVGLDPSQSRSIHT